MVDDFEATLPAYLRDYIDAQRKLADANGYARAKAEIARAEIKIGVEVKGRGAGLINRAPTITTERNNALLDSQPVGSRLVAGEEAGVHPNTLPRGIPEMLIEEAYFSIWPHSASGIDILPLIEKKHGVDIPKTTLYRVMKRLAKRGILEQVGSTAAWRIVAEYAARLKANPANTNTATE
jgi:hypothetical protein